MRLKEDGFKENIKCCKCQDLDKTIDDFYASNSSLYANKHLPICKDCLNRLYKTYALQWNDPKRAIKRICSAFDLYYNDKAFDACIKSAKTSIPSFGSYFKKLNMAQCKNKTFDDSIEEGFIFVTQEDDADNEIIEENNLEQDANTSTVSEAVRVKWGDGFTDQEYKMLQNHYKYLKKCNPNSDDTQESFINELCFYKMMQEIAVRKKDYDIVSKMGDSYRKTFQASGLRIGGTSDNNTDDCWGVWIERISQYTPEEYYKDKMLFNDYDKIGEYMDRFVKRPLKNLQFDTKERDDEYSVKDDYDEFTEEE